MDDALGLIGDHLDDHFDGSLEAARTPEVALLAAFISNSSVTMPGRWRRRGCQGSRHSSR